MVEPAAVAVVPGLKVPLALAGTVARTATLTVAALDIFAAVSRTVYWKVSVPEKPVLAV